MTFSDESLARLIYLSNFIAILMFIGVTVDISISYNQYQDNPSYFLLMESEKNLVGAIKEGVPFMYTAPIYIVYLLVIFSLLTCYTLIFTMEKVRNRIPLQVLLGLVWAMMVYRTARHISGGLSWIL